MDCFAVSSSSGSPRYIRKLPALLTTKYFRMVLSPLQGSDNPVHGEDEVNYGYGYTASVPSFWMRL